ncbi:DNA damage-inducible transcript 4-like protein [Sorex araneus]|uniref:DNA damage-inducible transcript 4-like protein n=1 Tax=Sorex araneus TaxID=42254 RepID=UPI002433AEF6|nr:DNA damage-inducible transcript 4-like protein [Sorex araneus]
MVATSGASSKAPATATGFHPDTDLDGWACEAPELGEVLFQEATCRGLARLLENCLATSKQSRLGCSRVLVPETLTQRVAQDVLRLAAGEPCGLRGCVLHVGLESGDGCRALGRIVCDASVVPTFELTLALKQESCSWASLRALFSRGRAPGLGRTLVLSSGFRLVKKKLYSLIEATVIEEC